MKLLLIGKIWPEPASSAAGTRTMGLIDAFLEAGWELTFASTAQATAHSVDLEARGVATHRIHVNDNSFDAWLEEIEPDRVIFDRYMIEEQFGWRVERVCPEALRILDTSDLHALRFARQQQLTCGGVLDLFNQVALREIASIFRSDLSLMISEFEIELLQEAYGVPHTILEYLPLMLPEPIVDPNPFEARRNFVMIGSFLHEPNWDAVQWCCAEIWPKIRDSLPTSELHIYGSYESEKARQLANSAKGIFLRGRAGDALETMQQYRVNLAPLRFGAGQKGKVGDGWLSGTPTVATPIAAEAMHGPLDWGCEITDDPTELARIAVDLHENRQHWEEVQRCGHRILRERFHARKWKPQLVERISELKVDARKENFIGQMLRHHNHRSTEFMSRWIEAKNKQTT